MGKRIFGDGPAWRQLRETTANQPVVSAAPPASVVLPVGDREVLVTVGAMVKVGQVIARSGALLAAPVHTSIAGKVTAIDRVPLSDGSRQLAVVIENDGTDAVFASVQPGGKLEVPALRDWLFAAGIDLPMSGGTIETVIVNAAGSEPSITADYRLLVEQAPDLVTGLLAAMPPQQDQVWVA